VAYPPVIELQVGRRVEVLPKVKNVTVSSYKLEQSEPLPEGLRLDERSGAIVGTPLRQETRECDIIADCDDGSPKIVRVKVVVVEMPPNVSYDPPVMNVHTPVSIAPRVLSGPVSSYRLSAGTLPQGLTLQPADGRIVGVPTQTESRAVEVTAQNNAGETRAQLRLVVRPRAPAIAYSCPDRLVVGEEQKIVPELTGGPVRAAARASA
jgi:hypothetical protein